MKILKIVLIILTVLVSLFLFGVGTVLFLDVNAIDRSVFSLFLLGCTGIFSVYFHIKTASYYPLSVFEKEIKEISKKYWALHIAFGIISIILGIGLLVPELIESNNKTTVLTIVALLTFIVYGVLSLVEVYKLNKFVEIYKERQDRQEEIDEITGVDSK